MIDRFEEEAINDNEALNAARITLLKAEILLHYRKSRESKAEENIKDQIQQPRLAQKLSEKSTGASQEMYNRAINQILEAAYEAIGYEEENKRTKEFWTDREAEEVIAEKRRLYKKWLVTQDDEDRKQYARTSIHTETKTHNADIYPTYAELLLAKKRCYSEYITVTEVSAEIVLQSLLDQTVRGIMITAAG
ncbi:hypothetical protein ILUMI_04671 [Ignelater luminosus]|uniref:Uncharacterized protein n=1 Tax=Ignelater luminosus TaxID=2038154 RepID=A0A8K0GKX1_IGNLU|nr:hypothetical protein ILUMI_04671 [Ignelater luminosus]